jgi:hypothetical protein
VAGDGTIVLHRENGGGEAFLEEDCRTAHPVNRRAGFEARRRIVGLHHV